jgi:hypothetical protein
VRPEASLVREKLVLEREDAAEGSVASLGLARRPAVGGEPIPLTEVIKLAVGNGHLHGLVLREVRRLEFVLLLVFAGVAPV